VDHIVGPSRKHAGANVAGARAVRVNDVGSFSLVVQECKNWIAGTYREVVRVVQHFIGHTTLRPVAAVYGGDGSVVAGIHRLVGKGVSDRADGRGHADPRTTQRLYGLTLYGAGRSCANRVSRAPEFGVVPRHEPHGKVAGCLTIAEAVRTGTVIEVAFFRMVGVQQDFVVAIVAAYMHIVVCLLQAKRSRIIDGGRRHIVGFLEVPLG